MLRPRPLGQRRSVKSYRGRYNSSVAQLLGDPQESGRLADELEALAEQHGFPFWLAAARGMRGRALAGGGETEAGLNLMRSGVDAYTATGGRDFRPYFKALLAEAALVPLHSNYES